MRVSYWSHPSLRTHLQDSQIEKTRVHGSINNHMQLTRTVMIQIWWLEVKKPFLFPQVLVLLVIALCSFLLSILNQYWRDKWLIAGLSLKVSISLQCLSLCPDVSSLTFGFSPGLCSLFAHEPHNCDDYHVLASSHLCGPLGIRRYVM